LPGSNRQSHSAIFFDLDGTLVDSRSGVVHAVSEGIRRCLNAHEIDMSPPDEDRIIAGLGRPATEYFRSLLPDELSHLAAEAQLHSTEFEVRALAEGQGTLFDGTLDALGRLAAADISIGIISNAQKGYFEAALQYLGLGELAEFRLCHDDLPVEEQPTGKTALLARGLQALRLDPGRVAMVGDRADDYRAASKHGCHGYAVRCGFGAADELAEADRVFADVAEIVDWILP
jgi:phosphoglycolate phosphatase